MMDEKNLMTKAQAQALTGLLHMLRPDWEPAGIMAALGRARGRGPVDGVVVGAVRAAVDGRNRTPGVIGQSGDHWVGAFRELQGPPRVRVCPVHGVAETVCVKRHQRSGVPGWWDDFRKGRVAPPEGA